MNSEDRLLADIKKFWKPDPRDPKDDWAYLSACNLVKPAELQFIFIQEELMYDFIDGKLQPGNKAMIIQFERIKLKLLETHNLHLPNHGIDSISVSELRPTLWEPSTKTEHDYPWYKRGNMDLTFSSERDLDRILAWIKKEKPEATVKIFR